jgi:serine/threonine-protein kinase
MATLLGTALEQRRELPVGLRVFVKRNARLGGVGGLLYVLSIPFMMGFAASLFGRRGADAALWTFAAAVTVVPFGILVARARRFLASGFGPEELGVAFRTELEQGREERLFEYGRGPSLYERVLRLLGVGGLAVAGLSGFLLFTSPAHYMDLVMAQIFGWSLAGGLVTGFLALVRLQRRVDLDTRIWSLLWQGPVGRLLFRIARLFVPASSLPPPATHRPTELALAMAAEQLFEQLPRETRRELRELPEVVRRLENDAQKMRPLLEELNDALGGTGKGTDRQDVAAAARHDRIVADLAAERDLVQRRLGDAVKALETIRLSLLRLHAGAGSVQRLSTDLGLARDVAAEINLLLEGHREIDRDLT